MNIKYLALAVCLTSLVGCGGGSNNNDSTAQQATSDLGNFIGNNNSSNNTTDTSNDEIVIEHTSEDGTTTRQVESDNKFYSEVVDANGAVTIYSLESAVWDYSDFVARGDFDGQWKSECLNINTTLNGGAHKSSVRYTWTFSGDAITTEETFYTWHDCENYALSDQETGTFTSTIETNAQGREVTRVSDLTATNINGQYLFSQDGRKFVLISGSKTYLGFNKVN